MHDQLTYPPAYFYNKYGKSYLLNYKCASTSIKQAIGKPKKSIRPTGQVYTYVRDPLDRAASIYDEMVKQRKHHGLPFILWLRMLKSGFDDAHQLPQTYYINQVPKIKLFTDLDKLQEYLGVRLKKLNPSTNKPDITPKEEQLIREIYADDFKLFKSL